MSSMLHHVGCGWKDVVLVLILCGKCFHVVHYGNGGADIVLCDAAHSSVMDDEV